MRGAGALAGRGDLGEGASMSDALHELVEPIRAALPDVALVMAFGSRVHGGADADSDLDLAIAGPAKTSPARLASLAEALAEKAGVPVDLVDLRDEDVAIALRHEAMAGRILFEIDDCVFSELATRILKEHADFRISRRPLENDLVARLSAHG
jgi:predicted nucleotidyltransferase